MSDKISITTAMTRRITTHLIIFVFCSGVALADEEDTRSFGQRFYDYWIDGASITAGIGTRQTSFTITRLSDNASGKLAHHNAEAYFLYYSTKPSYFRQSDFGYNWMFNLSSFNLTKQEVAKDTFVDLGTRVKGNFAYVVPTIFYNWGDKYQGTYIRTGIGLGVGIARFSGDILLTNSANPNERLSVEHHSTDAQFAASFMLEARYYNWGMLINVAGPTLEENGYEINVADASINVGYSYFF